LRLNKISVFTFLILAPFAILFYLLLTTDIFIDTIAILLVSVAIILAFFDHRYLILGLIFFAPYFHSIGLAGKLNIASNFTYNLYIPFIAGITILFHKKPGFRIFKDGLWYFLFIGYLIASIFFISKPNYELYRSAYSIYLIPYLIYLTVAQVNIDHKFINILTKIFIFHLLVLGMMSLFEYTTGKSLYTSDLIWQDVGLGRVAGPFKSPIIFGLFIQFMLSYFIVSYKLRLMSIKMLFLCISICTILMYFTFTRSVWIGYIVMIVYLVHKSNRKNIFIWFIISGIICISVFLYFLINSSGELLQRMTSDTFTVRLIVAYASLKMFMLHPFIGVGYGVFDDMILGYTESIFNSTLGSFTTSHITILTMLSELGLIGTIFFFLFFVKKLFRKSKIIANLLEYERSLIMVNIAFVITFVINAFLIDMRFFSMGYSLLFFSIGVVANIYSRHERVL
jgi:putative inorganic carbon (hco3(-)) transporter